MPSATIAQLIADPITRYPMATVACFDPTIDDLPRRRLDRERLSNFLSRLASAGAPAVLIAASTGQGHVRTVDELGEWFQAAADSPPPGMMLTALLRPEDGVTANEKLVSILAELPYTVIYVRPGSDLPTGASDDQVFANMQPPVRMIAGAGFAVGLYSIPDVSGVAMTANVAARLIESEGGKNTVAIKITEANYENSTMRFISDTRLARLKIVQGWDPYIARAMREGGARVGITSGPMSFAVYQYLHILQAASRNDWAEVTAAGDAVTGLFAAMQDNPRKFADLQRAKHIMGLGEPLCGSVSSAQVERVFAALAAIPRAADRSRSARSLDLMGDGPYHDRLLAFVD